MYGAKIVNLRLFYFLEFATDLYLTSCFCNSWFGTALNYPASLLLAVPTDNNPDQHLPLNVGLISPRFGSVVCPLRLKRPGLFSLLVVHFFIENRLYFLEI